MECFYEQSKQPFFRGSEYCCNLVVDPQFDERTFNMKAYRAFGQTKDRRDVAGGLTHG